MSHVLVVGGGIAGLWTAVQAADAGHAVELVTKAELAESNTRYAQGGIAAALFPDDSADAPLRRHARGGRRARATPPPCGCSATRGPPACAT